MPSSPRSWQRLATKAAPARATSALPEATHCRPLPPAGPRRRSRSNLRALAHHTNASGASLLPEPSITFESLWPPSSSPPPPMVTPARPDGPRQVSTGSALMTATFPSASLQYEFGSGALSGFRTTRAPLRGLESLTQLVIGVSGLDEICGCRCPGGVPRNRARPAARAA